MPAFIPQNPKVMVLVDANGTVLAVSNNIDPEIQVGVTTHPAEFERFSKGIPFNSFFIPVPHSSN